MKPVSNVLSYKWRTGMFAWVLHRLTGLALVFYLVMHIYSISHLSNPEEFDFWMNIYASPLFRVAELFLFATVLIHALNGVRILWVDFFGGARYHARLFWTLFVIGVVLLVLGAVPMVSHAFLN